MAHHFSRRSFDCGMGAASRIPAAKALSGPQSFPVSRDGMQLRIRTPAAVVALVSWPFAGCAACGAGRRGARFVALRAMDFPLASPFLGENRIERNYSV